MPSEHPSCHRQASAGPGKIRFTLAAVRVAAQNVDAATAAFSAAGVASAGRVYKRALAKAGACDLVSERQPIFNVPGVVVALLSSFVAVHVARYLLPEEQAAWLTAVLAFIPARLTGMAHELPGGDVASVTQFVTHIFVHGDLTHLAVNSAWLLAFGTSVARRIGAVRFLRVLHPVWHRRRPVLRGFQPRCAQHDGGSVRSDFGPDGCGLPLPVSGFDDGDTESLAGETRQPPLMSLGATLRDRRILLAVGGWTVLNIVLAWGACRAHGRGKNCLGGAPRRLLYGFADLRLFRPVTTRSA